MGIIGEVEKRFGQVNSTVVPAGQPGHRLVEAAAPVALLNLRGLRDDLRESNLYDTSAPPNGRPDLDLDELPKHRTYDGSLQDPTDPEMGRSAPASAATRRATRPTPSRCPS